MASTMTASVLSSLRAPVSLRQNTAGAAAVRRTPAVNVRARPPACSAALHHAPVGGLSQRRSAFSFAGVASVAARDRSLGRSGRGRIDARAASGGDESTASISKKVARAGGACKTLGRWGFWSQLVLATVSSVILVFSFLFKGITKATDAGLYFVLFGICAAYFTTFWSLGLVRLGDKLRQSATQLNMVPPRTEVVRQLSTGLAVNMVGLGSTLIGHQATTGLLFAKSLTAAAASPFTPGGYNPVLALDIFLLQAGSNVMFAHWIGAAIALWLLRTVNLPSSGQK